jgi:hypothetical protein
LTTSDAELAVGPELANDAELAVGPELANDAELAVGPEPAVGPEAVPEQPAHARITAKAATMRARMTRSYACHQARAGKRFSRPWAE